MATAMLVNGTAEKLANGHVPEKIVSSVITAIPKNANSTVQVEPIVAVAVTVAAPNTTIPTIKIPTVVTEEAQAKKSGIRIKYSGINNGKRITEQNRIGAKDKTPKLAPPIPSAVIVNTKTGSKENMQVLSAVAPKTVKEHEASLDEGVKLADIDDIELLDGSKIGFTPDLKPDAFEPNASLDTSIMSTASTELKPEFKPELKPKLRKPMNNGKRRRIASSRHKKMKTKVEPNCLYACRHCGKKYRWKSTLRRHENEECGDKEPRHGCPYCPYRAKQRGNLGVHVRKHHADKPELESKRKRHTM